MQRVRKYLVLKVIVLVPECCYNPIHFLTQLLLGQGVKICPHADRDALLEPHTHASLANIQTRLRHDRDKRLEYASPSKDIFCRTAAYLAALCQLGCSRPLVEPTTRSTEEEQEKEMCDIYWNQVCRGYHPKDGNCEGRLLFHCNSHGHPHIRYNHLFIYLTRTLIRRTAVSIIARNPAPITFTTIGLELLQALTI
jgi:hypothetical protein